MKIASGRRGDFFRGGRALHRNNAQEELAHLRIFQLVLRQRRVHQTWRDADDPDAAATKFQRATACDHVDAGLRRTIGHLALAGLAGVHRGDIDNDTGTLLLEHLPGGVFHAVEDTA